MNRFITLNMFDAEQLRRLRVKMMDLSMLSYQAKDCNIWKVGLGSP